MNIYFDHRRKPENGFAILEALIAFIVLGVGLLVLLSFHNASMQNIGDAKMRTEAMDLAQGKIQELRSFLDDDDVAGDWSTRLVNGNDTVNGVAATYTRTWTVDDVTDIYLANVSVTVAWADRDSADGSNNQDLTLNSRIFKVDPREASYVLNKAIAAKYDPDLGGDEEPDEPKYQYPPGEDPAAVKGPFTVTNPDNPDSSGTYQWRITISGDIDKKDNQNIELPDPQVSADYAAICDFGSTASYKGVRKKDTSPDVPDGSELKIIELVTPSEEVLSTDFEIASVMSYVDGTFEVAQGAELGTYEISYQICDADFSNCGATQTGSIDVTEFDGSYKCYAFFNEIEDLNNDGDYGWTGTLSFSVGGSGNPVFCFPIVDPNAFGLSEFDKTYSNIITNQNMFIQVASGVNGCDAQL